MSLHRSMSWGLIALVAFTHGCAVCNNCGDECYTFFGGAMPRQNMCSGRVGSRFDDASSGRATSVLVGDEAMAEEETIVEEGAAVMPGEEDEALLPVDEALLHDNPPTTSTPKAFTKQQDYLP